MGISDHKAKWLSRRVLKTALVNGLLLNMFGWIGNAIILRGEWREAVTIINIISPLNISGPLREVLTLVPDFIYGYLMIIIYLYIGVMEGFTRKAKYKRSSSHFCLDCSPPTSDLLRQTCCQLGSHA